MRTFLIVLIGLILAGCTETAVVIADAVAYGLSSHRTQDEIVDEILYDIRTGGNTFASQYYGKSQLEVQRMLGANGCVINRYGYLKYVFKTNTTAGNIRTTSVEFRFRNAQCISVKHWSNVERIRPSYHDYHPMPMAVPVIQQAPQPVAPIVINNNNNLQSAPPVVFGPNNNNLMK